MGQQRKAQETASSRKPRMAVRTRVALAVAIGLVVVGVPATVAAVQSSADPAWVAPVNAPIWDGFRPPGREYHDGVDIGADKFVPIRAVSAGRVIVRECNAHINGTPYSCDIDGSPTVRGCGWYVDIAHAGGIITRYCHMAIEPLVKLGDTVITGQRIGYVGSSGNSSAPHLHFQVHVIPAGQPLDAEPENAVDPVAFMAARGAPLGRGNDVPSSPTATPTITPPTPPAVPLHQAATDIDGDGTSELVVWRPSEGQWYLRKLASTAGAPIPLGIDEDVPVVGDYDGDGLDDLAVWRQSDGRWLVQTSSGAPVSDPVLGTPEDYPVPGDYDGDGKTDFAVWQPFGSVWLVLHAAGAEAAPVEFGLPGDLPVVADYDGDGRSDLAVWRPDGQWLVQASSGIELPPVVLGVAGDIPVPGDYDGDGLADFAVWRAAEAQWYVRYATGAAAEEPVAFGADGDRPVVGDYDGDGVDDLALWRPADGTWSIQLSSSDTLVEIVHGVTGDVPANSPQWLDADGTPLTLADLLARRFALAKQRAADAAATPPTTQG
jgi:hypothetical protein